MTQSCWWLHAFCTFPSWKITDNLFIDMPSWLSLLSTNNIKEGFFWGLNTQCLENIVFFSLVSQTHKRTHTHIQDSSPVANILFYLIYCAYQWSSQLLKKHLWKNEYLRSHFDSFSLPLIIPFVIIMFSWIFRKIKKHMHNKQKYINIFPCISSSSTFPKNKEIDVIIRHPIMRVPHNPCSIVCLFVFNNDSIALYFSINTASYFTVFTEQQITRN